MSASCGCMDMWLVFLTLILLTRFSQRGSLMSGGGQWADHVPRGCSRLTGISRRWGWAWHLPGGWPDGGPWSTSGKWMQQRAVLAHAPIPDPDLTFPSIHDTSGMAPRTPPAVINNHEHDGRHRHSPVINNHMYNSGPVCTVRGMHSASLHSGLHMGLQ